MKITWGELKMDNYIIDMIIENDIAKILDIYNSNKSILKNHIN